MSEASEKTVIRRPVWLPEKVQTGLQGAMGHIATLLPKDIPVEHFRAALMLHLPKVINLERAMPESVVGAIVKMAMDGMLPERDAVMVVFKNKAERLVMYSGLLRALDRTGKVVKAYAQCVYSNDFFEIDLGQDIISHKPLIGKKRGHMVGAYAIVAMKNGAKHQHWMDMEDLDRVRNTSLGRDQDAWLKHPSEMYRKSVLKNLCKYVKLTDGFTEEMEEEDLRPDDPARIIDQGQRATVELFGDEPARPFSAHGQHSNNEAIDGDVLEEGTVGSEAPAQTSENEEDNAEAPTNLQGELAVGDVGSSQPPTPDTPQRATPLAPPAWRTSGDVAAQQAREVLAHFAGGATDGDGLRQLLARYGDRIEGRSTKPAGFDSLIDTMQQETAKLQEVLAAKEKQG